MVPVFTIVTVPTEFPENEKVLPKTPLTLFPLAETTEKFIVSAAVADVEVSTETHKLRDAPLATAKFKFEKVTCRVELLIERPSVKRLLPS